MTFTRRSPNRWAQWGWLLAGLAALLYFLSSVVVVLNSVGNANGSVWLPSFPAWYYTATHLLYWPFQPYFRLLAPLQQNPAITYSTFTLVSRGPIIIVALLVLGVAIVRAWPRRRRPSRLPAQELHVLRPSKHATR